MNGEIENLLEDAAGSFVKHAGTGHWKVRFSMFFGRRKMDDLRTQLLQLVWNYKGRIRLISSENPNENDPSNWISGKENEWILVSKSEIHSKIDPILNLGGWKLVVDQTECQGCEVIIDSFWDDVEWDIYFEKPLESIK